MMEIKWKELKKPFKVFGSTYTGITLFPYIFIYIGNKTKRQIAILKNHEMIHAAQVTEQGIISWYWKYIMSYLKNILGGYFTKNGMNHREAYHAIPYEKEAYANQDNLNYLEGREEHAWKKYK